MAKPICERINAIVIVLERLASDVEIIREGLEALKAFLPQKYDMQRRLLHEQASALERITGLTALKHRIPKDDPAVPGGNARSTAK